MLRNIILVGTRWTRQTAGLAPFVLVITHWTILTRCWRIRCTPITSHFTLVTRWHSVVSLQETTESFASRTLVTTTGCFPSLPSLWAGQTWCVVFSQWTVMVFLTRITVRLGGGIRKITRGAFLTRRLRSRGLRPPRWANFACCFGCHDLHVKTFRTRRTNRHLLLASRHAWNAWQTRGSTLFSLVRTCGNKTYD